MHDLVYSWVVLPHDSGMNIQAFLFDMDGLLIDTEDLHMRAFAETATQLGYPSQPRDFVCWIGHSAGKMSKWLVEKCPADVTPEEIISIEQAAFMRILLEERPEPLPGATDMVAECDRLNLKRGLVSSTIYPQVVKTMEVVLGHMERSLCIDDTFQTTVTGDRVKNLKPDPEPYLKGAEGLGVEPGACVVFEDSTAGIASARAAGCKAVAIPNFYLDYDEVSEKAHATFKTLAEAFDAKVWESL